MRNSGDNERENKKYLNKFVYFFIQFDFMLYYLLTLNIIFYKINKKIPNLIFINCQYILLSFKIFQKFNFLTYK